MRIRDESETRHWLTHSKVTAFLQVIMHWIRMFGNYSRRSYGTAVALNRYKWRKKLFAPTRGMQGLTGRHVILVDIEEKLHNLDDAHLKFALRFSPSRCAKLSYDGTATFCLAKVTGRRFGSSFVDFLPCQPLQVEHSQGSILHYMYCVLRAFLAVASSNKSILFQRCASTLIVDLISILFVGTKDRWISPSQFLWRNELHYSDGLYPR